MDRLAEGSEDYNAAQKALEENGVEFDSFAALDIRFELNGEEVEPDHPVQVKITANNVLPEDVDPATVAVQHLKENEDGTVTVENVAVAETVDENTVQADMPAMMAAAPADEQAGEAQPAEEPGTVTAEGSELIAEFTVESFSHFTITGRNGYYIKVKYANVQGDEIQVKNSPNSFEVNSRTQYDVWQWKREPYDTSLTFIGAYLDFVPEGTKYPVKYIKYENGNWYYLESDNSEWKLTPYQGNQDKGTIWFLYGYETYEVPVDENRVKNRDDGISIDLFDYTKDFNSKSQENGWDFYFVGDGVMDPGNRTAVNSYVGGAFALQGIVKNELKNNFPVLSTNDKQMDFLFGDENKTHDNLTGLFKEDKDGYYIYDSKANFASVADAAKKNGEFTVYEYPYGNLDSADSPHFLPYNDIVSTSEESFTKDTIILKNYEAANYHFGLTMDFNFIQPKQGLVNQKNMVFEFDGDDDVWVFIDDVLVLDLGGIHGSVHGSIDFKTGKVVVDDAALLSESNNNSLGDNECRETTLRALFEDALGKEDPLIKEYFAEGSNTFKDYTSHTFKYYYLERGASGSNCKIKFNLNTIPAGTIEVEKSIENAVVPGFSDAEFTMKVLVSETEEGTYSAYNGAYTIYDADTHKEVRSGTTNDGTFVLKNGEYARLGENIRETTWYKVQELKVDKYDADYEFNLHETSLVDPNGSSVGDEVMGQSVGLQVGHTQKVVVQNYFTAKEKTMFVLEKKMSDGQTSQDSFTFKVTNGNGDPYVGNYYVCPIEQSTLPDEKDAIPTNNGTIVLKQNEKAIILGVTSGSNIVVEEEYGNNYNAPSYSCNTNCIEVDRTDDKYQVEIAPIGSTTGNEKIAATVTCTNSYATGTLQITKNVEGLDDLSKLKESLQFEVSGTYDGKNVYQKTVMPSEIKWNEKQATVTLNVPIGIYTVTEENYGVEGYTCVANPVDGSQKNIQVVKEDTVTAGFVNTYTPANGNLLISKKLTGINTTMGDDVTFIFKITGPTDKTGVTPKTYYRYLTFSEDDFKNVQNGESVTKQVWLKDVPVGTYTVTELKAAGYTCEGKNSQDAVVTSGMVTSAQVEFTNKPVTDDPTPGDQNFVENKFNWDVQKEEWVWVQANGNQNENGSD